MEPESVKAADVRKQIKSGETGPLYLIEGDDLHSRHDLALEFAAVVDEGLQAFNVQSFYANEAATAGARDQLIGEILLNARTLPMMSPRRVLIVHEADRLLSPRRSRDDEPELPLAADADKKRRKSVSPAEELEQYFESPEPLTTLVFVAGPLDGNRRLVKILRKHAQGVNAGSLETAAEANRWIQKRLEQDRLTIEPRASSLLVEATGLNFGRLRAEVEKLVLYASGDKVVTTRHVKDLVMPQSESSEEFALGKAIWNGRPADALREIGVLIDEGMPPVMVLGQIRAAVGRLKSDERATAGLNAVFEADLAIKSSMGEPRFVLERLVIELCSRR